MSVWWHDLQRRSTICTLFLYETYLTAHEARFLLPLFILFRTARNDVSSDIQSLPNLEAVGFYAWAE